MKLSYAFGALCCLAALTSQVNGATLYASTSFGGAGELYILNSATGAIVQDIGPLKDSGGTAYPVTGLAFQPSTGVLFGSTGNSGATGTATKLITINPATAVVTVVGAYNVSGFPTATMTDITFSTTGSLCGIGSSGGAHLYSIDPGTGAATLLGNSGFAFTTGGGIAASPANVFYGSPDAAHFGTYDSGTGAYTQIAAPTTPLSGSAYAALAFNGTTLYGINLQNTGSRLTHLVTLDTATGVATDLGASVNAIDAIAFQPGAAVSDWSCY